MMVERPLSDIESLYQINKEMIKQNLLVHEIKLNNENKILTYINNIPYVLMEIFVNKNAGITLSEICHINNNSINIKCDNIIARYDWVNLWETKNDYLETQINEIGKKYPNLCTFANYYIGLAENAISYVRMANLLEDVAKTNIPRIRFVTSHPWDFTDDMIDIIAKYDNIMPYIHLPLQSGSTKILQKMGRKYTKEEYRELFYKIKNKIKNVSITTDIIVGFPGESKEDFQETLDLVDELKYDLAYTFIYSKREGTPASNFKDETTEEEKKERLAELNKKINQYALENNQKYLNKVVPVLVEGPSDKEGKLMGYTDNMKLVNVAADESYIGKIINVKITEVKTWSLEGTIND